MERASCFAAAVVLGAFLLAVTSLFVAPTVDAGLSATMQIRGPVSGGGGHQNKSTDRRPLVFNAGHGTTGTHSFYEATCRLGINSVHGKIFCAPMNETTPGISAHRKLMRSWIIMLDCAGKPRRMNCPSVDQWVSRALRLIDAVISFGDIDAIHDSPYPYFASYIIDAAKRLRGVAPIILLSERDPADWAFRRSQHPQAPICKLLLNETNTGDTKTFERGPHKNYGSLDILYCVDLAKEAKESTLESTIADVIAKIGALYKGDQSGGRKQYTKGLKDYQDSLRPYADYNIDLFKQDPRMDDDALIQDLIASVPDMIKYWRRESPLQSRPLFGRSRARNRGSAGDTNFNL